MISENLHDISHALKSASNPEEVKENNELRAAFQAVYAARFPS